MNLKPVSWAAAVLLATLSLTGCGGSTVIAPMGSPTNAPISPLPRAFSQAAVTYFGAIAFGAEYSGGDPVIRKWTEDVRIGIHGDPTAADLAALGDVIFDLNTLIDTIDVSVVRSGQNVDLYFAPEARFSSIEPGYIPVNMGFFWTWWDETGALDEAHILISTTGVTQAERDHLIREELTQSLGLMQDSYAHEDSVFYQGWTDTPAYSPLDEQLIEMLYLPAIVPGMTADEALAVIPRG